MEAAKEGTIPHYLPILDDISIQKTVLKDGAPHCTTDLCILFKIYVLDHIVMIYKTKK